VPAHASSPYMLPPSCKFEDNPEDAYVLQGTNDLTRKPNFLHRVNIEMRFCTVLTLLWPGGRFEHLKHVFWNLHWEYFFTPPARAGDRWSKTRMTTAEEYPSVGKVLNGAPAERWARDVLTAADAPNCLDIAGHQSQNAIVYASTGWSDFGEQRTPPKS